MGRPGGGQVRARRYRRVRPRPREALRLLITAHQWRHFTRHPRRGRGCIPSRACLRAGLQPAPPQCIIRMRIHLHPPSSFQGSSPSQQGRVRPSTLLYIRPKTPGCLFLFLTIHRRTPVNSPLAYIDLNYPRRRLKTATSHPAILRYFLPLRTSDSRLV